ncbi:amidohydrolase [Candidatus Bathyarchaeota archaeon]|nr:amidohydrolase [Candidatus Bathyarchaeota archaeon]
MLTSLTEPKKTAFKWIEENEERLSDFHQRIWNYAETSFREYKSVKAFAEFHKEEGFEVELGVAGMPTAYLATWGEGEPVLSTYTEYDAVPARWQDPVPYRSAENPYRAGHTDPHSALGTGALAGAVAVKHAMEKHGLEGKIKVFGTPAEKVCAKSWFAAKGLFEGLDACVAWHPRGSTTVMYETQWGSYWNAAFVFECNEPETWMAYAEDLPRNARAPGALDAVCMMYTNTKYLKEAMLPRTGLWTINEAVMAAGQATADNMPPKIGIIQYAFRSPSLTQQEQIAKVLINNAENVARITGTNVKVRWVTKQRTGLFNKALADLAYENLELIGPPKFTDDDKSKANEILKNLGYDSQDEPFNEELTSPEEWEAMWRSVIPSHQKKFGSDDYVEFMWHCPTVWIQVYRPRISVEGEKLPYWPNLALGGMKGPIDRTIYTAGKSISGTMMDLLTEPGRLQECKDEWKRRIAREYEEPQLDPSWDPPIDLPWPEYVVTERGYDWHIPTPKA